MDLEKYFKLVPELVSFFVSESFSDSCARYTMLVNLLLVQKKVNVFVDDQGVKRTSAEPVMTTYLEQLLILARMTVEDLFKGEFLPSEDLSSEKQANEVFKAVIVELQTWFPKHPVMKLLLHLFEDYDDNPSCTGFKTTVLRTLMSAYSVETKGGWVLDEAWKNRVVAALSASRTIVQQTPGIRGVLLQFSLDCDGTSSRSVVDIVGA